MKRQTYAYIPPDCNTYSRPPWRPMMSGKLAPKLVLDLPKINGMSQMELKGGLGQVWH